MSIQRGHADLMNAFGCRLLYSPESQSISDCRTLEGTVSCLQSHKEMLFPLNPAFAFTHRKQRSAIKTFNQHSEGVCNIIYMGSHKYVDIIIRRVVDIMLFCNCLRFFRELTRKKRPLRGNR
jgi:hypothetical protein